MVAVNRLKLVSCALTLALFILSVTITFVRLADTDGIVLRSTISRRREHLKYDDLSKRVHCLYREEMDLSANATFSNETLGVSAFHPLDIRNQSINAPRAYNLAMVYPQEKGCNCVVDMNGRGPCCVRYYRRPHKMGNIQSLQLLPDGVRDLIRITSSDFLKKPPVYDYRDVVLMRDLYTAVISGYLYHISGRECWLDMYGRPTNFTFRWIDNFWQNWTLRAYPREMRETFVNTWLMNPRTTASQSTRRCH